MFQKTRIACGVVLAAALGAPVHAASVELVQAGDAELSCQVLAAQINDLSADRAKAAKRAASGRKLLGFAATALQVASSGGFGGKLGAGNQSGYIAQQALGALQAQAMQQQMMGAAGQGFGADLDQPAQSPADTSVEAQRLARLNDLHARKGC